MNANICKAALATSDKPTQLDTKSGCNYLLRLTGLKNEPNSKRSRKTENLLRQNDRMVGKHRKGQSQRKANIALAPYLFRNFGLTQPRVLTEYSSEPKTNKGLKNQRLENGKADTSGLGGHDGLLFNLPFFDLQQTANENGLGWCRFDKKASFDSMIVTCSARFGVRASRNWSLAFPAYIAAQTENWMSF
ncbi:hypothetical protein [Novipirellula caenicola]|uniref:hypothetical protein n=1 Tax=Novipirellula caenicola TaxID=1536901 RepID=UPI0031F04D84